MPEEQSAPVVKQLMLALQQALLAYAFLIFFRDDHHTEIPSCDACVHGLRSKTQKSLSRFLLVRCCEHAKLNGIIVISQDVRLGEAVAFKKPLQCHTGDYLDSTALPPLVLCPLPLLPIAHEQRISAFLFFFTLNLSSLLLDINKLH